MILIYTRMRFTRVLYGSKNIFNRSKKRMQKSWASKREDRENFQYIRQIMAADTADRVLDVRRSWNTVLELGCDQG